MPPSLRPRCMLRLWESVKAGYLRLIEPVADFLVRRRVNPNTLTTIGTACTVAGGVVYATGHISAAGWIVGLTALFDVLDGTVARRTGRSTVFGAFYDSTLDRIADGVVLGGLTMFYATSAAHYSVPMIAGSMLVQSSFAASASSVSSAAVNGSTPIASNNPPLKRSICS